MAVLSDKSIRERMAAGQLVINGEVQSALHCAYEFSASTMFKGGASTPDDVGDEPRTIEPAELVWIRAKETVDIPKDMVGLWVQTQTLSRQGLLLLNTTIIEPGYKGPLTAVLVNFGQRRVALDRSSKIAKVVFLRLDGAAVELVDGSRFADYDRRILDVSANSPKTFLSLDKHLPDLKRDADAALADLKRQLGAEAEDLRRHLASDVGRQFLKWGGGAVAGLVLGCLVVWFGVATLLPQMVASYAEVRQTAEKALESREADLAEKVRSELQSDAALKNLQGEIDQLKKANHALEQEVDHLRKNQGR